ncbi:MAG: flagellar biosynthesis protein FlhA [Syntrophales bacterium]|jgi:flagellar biosynthesis protein FlhA|nr:flagellar biosynthesis protein FlhA [Syntrophales bacterium]
MADDLKKHKSDASSAVVSISVVAILIVMILPMPAVALDILLSISLTAAIIILMMSMYVRKPLQFSIFPSVLLIVTLLRLSLNLASTRLILLHGNEGVEAAGQVIKSFGTFIVGGNYVVGFVVFIVLVIINFVVITKGATRIAEVAARFTLDAMPGKQMSIDADLNTGLISDTEARKRRREIERESSFYGAMDGASKFVRGDAIAGIIITAVNIIGGLIIGILQQGMPIAEAARNYTLLTVGDGLVSQVPALIVSTAAGMLVTRTAEESELGVELKNQIFSQPKAVGAAALLLFIFALIPGMPKFSFMLIAGLTGLLAFFMLRSARTAAPEEAPPVAPVEEAAEGVVPFDLLGLEVGYGLIYLVDASQNGELLAKIKALRKQIAQELGFVVPSIHIKDNLQLKPNEYSVLMKGVEIAGSELMPGYSLAITTDVKGEKIRGIETKEPAFSLPAVWVTDAEKERLQMKGVVVVDPATVLVTHLTEILKSHADELLGRQEVQQLLDNLKETYPKLIEEVVPKIVPLGTLQKVMQKLLRERVSIRDLQSILETLADYMSLTKNVDVLTGYVRQSLARAITRQYQDPSGNITVMMISPAVEDKITGAVQHTEFESFVSPDPNMVKGLVGNLQKLIVSFTEKGLQPIILCSPNTRIYLRKILEKFFPNLVVLSHNEIVRDVNIRSLGMVEL